MVLSATPKRAQLLRRHALYCEQRSATTRWTSRSFLHCCIALWYTLASPGPMCSADSSTDSTSPPDMALRVRDRRTRCEVSSERNKIGTNFLSAGLPWAFGIRVRSRETTVRHSFLTAVLY